MHQDLKSDWKKIILIQQSTAIISSDAGSSVQLSQSLALGYMIFKVLLLYNKESSKLIEQNRGHNLHTHNKTYGKLNKQTHTEVEATKNKRRNEVEESAQ